MDSESSSGLGCELYDNMWESREKIAQIDGISGHKDSYASLLQRSIRIALKMKEKGIRTEDIVLTCSFNYIDTCVPFLATQFLGAITSALDPSLSFDDMVHLLKQVHPKLIFTTQNLVETFEKVLLQVNLKVEIVIFDNQQTAEHTPFEDFLRPSDQEKIFRPTEIRDLNKSAFVLFSSGTTGLPKGILINNHRFLANCKTVLNGGHAYDITLSTASLYWISAYLFLVSTVLKGFTRIILPVFTPESIWKAINQFRPTFMYANPTQLMELAAQKHQFDRSETVRHIMTGGVPVFQKHVDVVKSAFPNATVFCGYGQTESGLIACFTTNEIDLLQRYPFSCGKVVSQYDYKVVDLETGEPLGPNQSGELLLKGQIILNGYYNADDSHVWENGWYKTGDIVHFNKEGCLYVEDRVKELMKFQSWHVPPAAIEQVLITHPAIQRCLVIGIPHEIDGDHPMALVVLKEAFKDTQPEEIQKFVEERVDNRKRLRGGVKIVEKFPIKGAGKVNRRVVKQMVLSGEL